jgi:hypothetical protein
MSRLSRLAILSGCLWFAASASCLAQARGSSSASTTVSVTATVRPSCTIRVGVSADSGLPSAQLRCAAPDVARAVITVEPLRPAGTTSIDPVTRVVTIQF